MDENTGHQYDDRPLSSKEKADLKEDIFQRLQLPATPGKIRFFPGGFKSWVFRAVAAAVVLILMIPLYYWLRPEKFRKPDISEANTEIRAGVGETKRITLRDGTVIVLNASSVLHYHSSLHNNKIREVQLQGNAFFSVAKSHQQVPFVVSTSSLTVTVLGTSINVNARDAQQSVELTNGKVKVESKRSAIPAVYLQPGEKVSLDAGNKAFQRTSIDTQLYEAWTEGRWNFTNTTLGNIAELLNEYYGTQMTFKDPSKAALRITAVLPVTSVRKLAEVIEKTLPVKIETNNNQLIVL